MENLVERVAGAANISADQARRAVGLIFAFLQKEAPAADVEDMLRAVPGAEQAAADAETEQPGGGGLLGGMMGMMGGGGLMGLAGRLTGIGLGMGEMAAVGKELFAYAKEKAGEERVNRVANAIPGLGQFL